MTITSITDIDVKGKVLVIRADLNAPMKDGIVTDATRIERFAEGLKPLLAKGARAVVLSHFARPKGQIVPEMSLAPIAPELAKALGTDVRFVDDCIGDAPLAASAALQDGQVILCENLRFHKGEEANDPAFAAQLAQLGEFYVNDAFSTAHRAHASTAAIADILPAFSGPLMDEETAALSTALENPKSPAVALIGGAKVSSKIAVLKNLVKKVDAVIIGGGMANTFFFADGHAVGKSLCEEDQVETVREIQKLAKAANCELVLPLDIVYAFKFADSARSFIADVTECPEDGIILDAGPKSVIRFRSVLANAQTVLWNGPLGAFEMRPFEQATKQVALEVAELTRDGLVTSVAGGGDTVAALNMAGVAEDFTYISSAGGAFLEWLEGKELPGIAALDRDQAA
ncbi:MAG: phosphoglycerate kinase [Alphaproteobacteria bacterium]|nr:phosphoglycerate kinase [Alphaproteobacteria bacterium]